MEKLYYAGIKDNQLVKGVVEVMSSTDKTYFLGDNKLGRKSVTKKQLNVVAGVTRCVGNGANVIATTKNKAITLFTSYIQEEIDKYCKMKEELFDKNSWIE